MTTSEHQAFLALENFLPDRTRRQVVEILTEANLLRRNDGVTFAVITRVPDHNDENAVVGNLTTALTELYAPVNLYNPNDGGYVLAAVDPSLLGVAMHMRVPVFHVGEVLLLGYDGREIGGRGRKPSKWDVGVETFAYVGDAIARAHEVSEAEMARLQQAARDRHPSGGAT